MSERDDERPRRAPDEGDAPPAAAPAVPPAAPPAFPPAQREGVAVAIGATLATAAAIHYAFSPERAGSAAMLLALGLLYALFAAAAFLRFRRRGELLARLRPAGGDLTLGAATAGILYGLTRIAHFLVAPHGSPREAWIVRLYLQLGDPQAEGRTLLAGAAFAVAVLEEITWRGLVMSSLEAAYGVRRAVVISSVLFAAAHIPSLFALADPVAGPNPLIVLAALGCGLVWGTIYARTSRIVPGIFAHALFTWAVVEFPIWRP